MPLAAFAEAHWRTNFGAFNSEDQREMRRTRRLAACLAPPRQVQTLWREGAALTLADAVSLALS